MWVTCSLKHVVGLATHCLHCNSRAPNFPLSLVSYAAKLDILFSVLHVRPHAVVSLCTADSTALSTPSGYLTTDMQEGTSKNKNKNSINIIKLKGASRNR